jgi:hypothetical protein
VKARNDPTVIGAISGLDPIQWFRFSNFFTAGHGDGGCWLWDGSVNARGYGRFAITHTERRYAHRVMFTLLRKSIPFGMELHHTCGKENCINPYHMDTVDFDENIRYRNKANGWGEYDERLEEIPF